MQEVEKVEEILTLKQERFCRNYTQNYELYGNSTLSYAEAFGYDLESQPKDDAVYEQDEKGKDTSVVIIKSSYHRMYDDCSAHGSRLRKKDKIQARCRELLNEFLRDEVIDARLAEIILKGDDKDSIQAIKEYNKLKQRITEKTDITSGGKPIINIASEIANKNGLNSGTEGNS